MSAIASTRVVLAARQSTLGRGRERRERRRVSPVDGIAARSRIADTSATLRVTTKIAGVPTRRARDGARCLAGPEQLFQLADGGGLSPIVPLLSILGGFAIARTVVYWRVQFITASMIGRHVPPGARRVLEYGVGQGKNLYYYPKSVGMVVGIDPDAKEDLLIQVSVASGVPFVAKKQPLESGSGQADASIDAVVSTGSFGKVRDPEALLREAARVLKPGAPLVFVEDLGTLNEKGDALDALTTSAAAEALFEPAQYDDLWATLPLAPTAIGVVVRKGGDPDLGAAPGGAAAKKKDDFETATGLTGKRGKRKKGARK